MTTPRTWAKNDLVTHDLLNAEVRDRFIGLDNSVGGFVGTPGSATDQALRSIYIAPWKANTFYPAGQAAISPNGDVVTAKVAFTSGTTFNASNWNLSTTFAPATGSATYETQSHAASTYQTTTGLDSATAALISSGSATRTATDALYALPASPAAYNIPMRNSGNTGLAWTTSSAVVARALGWIIVTDAAYGADPTGATDSTTAVRNAIAAVDSLHSVVFFPPGLYKMTGNITWDTVLASILGAGGSTKLDFTGVSSGYCINVVGVGARSSSFNMNMATTEFSHMSIVGPDSDATTVDGFYFNDTSNLSQITLSNLAVYGFRDQAYYDTNNWCITWNGCTFGHGHRRLHAFYSGANAGENYRFNSCTFYSSTNAGGNATAFYLDAGGGADIYCFGCSFDYNDVQVDHQGGVLNLIGCHLEDHSAGPMIKLTQVGGQSKTVFTMLGGALSGTEASPGRSHYIEHTASSTNGVSIGLRDVNYGTYNKDVQIVQSLASAPPMLTIRGGYLDNSGTNYAAGTGETGSLLYNGYFESATGFGNPGWQTTGFGSLTTGAIDTTKPKSGSRSLHILSPSTGSATVFQFFPIPPDTRIQIRGYYWLGSTSGGTIDVRYASYRTDYSTTGGTAPTTTRNFITTLLHITAATTGWTPFSVIWTPPKGIALGYFDLVPVGTLEAWFDEIEVSAI